MSVKRKFSKKPNSRQKLLLWGSLTLILAFSTWRFSLFDGMHFMTEKATTEAAVSADMLAIQIGFHIKMPLKEAGFVIEDLRFYVHKLELLASGGQIFPIQLKTPSTYQGIALVDLSRESTMVIHGWVSHAAQSANIRSLGFKLGVPFASNHANPLQAQTPLNESGMFWVWQQGYKFFKLDFRASSGRDISYHMGSAGCESASALRPPSLACNYPNRAQIVLDVTDVQSLAVEVDPWSVLRAMQNQQVQLCTAAANFSRKCAKAMKLFGIDPLTGMCEKSCLGQQVFSSPWRDLPDV